MATEHDRTGSGSIPAFAVAADALDVVLPMHLLLDADRRIVGIGRTLARVFGPALRPGQAFMDVFSIVKPRHLKPDCPDEQLVGRKILVQAHTSSGPIRFRSVVVSIALNGTDRGYLLAFSLGIDMPTVVERHHLKEADFSPADNSVDMLHLFQTQKELLHDAQQLAGRLEGARQDAERMALTDPGTGLSNRRALMARLETLERQSDRPYAVLHIDLDGFKQVNDTFGHAAGDKLLEHAAAALLSGCRGGDMAARIGGDEFVLLLLSETDQHAVLALANDLIERISRPVEHQGQYCSAGASIGVTFQHPGEPLQPERVLSNADIAMYEAKQRGRNQVAVLNPSVQQRYEQASELVREIRDGLDRGEFAPHFQPQIDARDSTVIGVEALVRWNNPRRGVLAPPLFLHVAERAKLLDDIDRAVRATAFQQMANWRERGVDCGRVSLNLGASNLRREEIIEELLDEVLAAGLTPAMVRLELLESVLLDNRHQLLATRCMQLHNAGFALALDDFGTGHASISTLIEVPISLLKVDRNFVAGIDTNPKLRTITGAMLAMAQRLEIQTLAEGVETLQEVQTLRTLGCHRFQGYQVCRPISGDLVPAWIEEFAQSGFDGAQGHQTGVNPP